MDFFSSLQDALCSKHFVRQSSGETSKDGTDINNSKTQHFKILFLVLRKQKSETENIRAV